ncbi:MAG TPA: hypothetical protein PK096_04815 [Candidatus Saccharibacteria bacterium]|nr:hypothetical protein [Candidatus Saccharibacteria bacterium]HRK94657.1 hypothetical protein [Candidatus Saccharibacteria bacterium]
MSEALALEHQYAVQDRYDGVSDDDSPVLSLVSEPEGLPAETAMPPVSTIVDSLYDDSIGQVVRPSIDVATKRLANGQPLEVFFDRGPRSGDVELKIARALAEATKLYQQSR